MIKILLILLTYLSSSVWATEINLNIQGIDDPEILALLKTKISLKALAKEDNKTLADKRVLYLHQQAQKDITKTLKVLGYYQVILDLKLKQVKTANEDRWQADYHIQLGQITLLQSLDIVLVGEGKTDSVFTEIVKNLTLQIGDPAKNTPFLALKQQMQAAAKQKGYVEAKIQRAEMVISADKQTAQLYFHFDTGKRYDANVLKNQVSFEITGVEDKAILANIKTYLSLYKQSKSAKKILSKSRIRYLYKQTQAEIKQALEPFGYYKSSITHTLLDRPATDTDIKGWSAQYHIELGIPTLITILDIHIEGEGKTDTVLTTLIDKFSLKAGDRLLHAPYETLKTSISKAAENQGYFEAKSSRKEISINPKTNTASIYYYFDSGRRYRFGEVSFKQTRFQDWVLRRYISFKPGDYYDRQALLDFRSSLGISGYFKEIDIKKIKHKDTAILDLEVNTVLARADNYRVQIGYGTDSALRFGLNAGWAQLNRYGHSVKLRSKISMEQNRFLNSIEYRVPTGSYQEHFFNTILSYRAEDFRAENIGLDQKFAIVGAKTRDTNLSLGLEQHRIRSIFGLKMAEIIGFSYTLEQYDLLPLMFDSEAISLLQTLAQENLDPTITTADLNSLNPNYKILSPKISWVYTETDNPIYTTHGQQIKLSLTGSREGWGSNTSFWQISLHSAMIRRLHQKGRIILRNSIAYTDAETRTVFGLSNTINNLPKSLQYRAGGDRSIRGYGFESLDGGSNTLVSAKHLLTGSIEYEYRFLKDWSWAAFVDIGNAFNNIKDIQIETGVGTGIRWHSPVGLVRLDIAFPVTEDASDFRFHLNVGPDF